MPLHGIFTPGQQVYFTTGNGTAVQHTVPADIQAGAQTGDYIGCIVIARGNGGVISYSGAGQSWTLETQIANGTTSRSVLAWCFYDGVFDTSFTTETTTSTEDKIVAWLWRRNVSSTNPGSAWDDGGTNYAAPGSPFDQARAGQVTTVDLEEVIYAWQSQDDNTWSLSTANGCTIYGQQVITTGGDMSAMVAGKVVSPPADSGTTTARQATLGGDAGCNHVFRLRPASYTWIKRPLHNPMTQLLSH